MSAAAIVCCTIGLIVAALALRLWGIDHGLPYVHNGSFLEAVGSHARVLKELGSADPRVNEVQLARAA